MEPLYLLFYEFASAAARLKVRIWPQTTTNLLTPPIHTQNHFSGTQEGEL